MTASNKHRVVRCNSLSDCMRTIESEHSGPPVSVPTFSAVDDSPGQPQLVPRFLFRGENGLYPSLTSSMDRFRQDASLDVLDREQIETATLALDEHLRRHLGLSRICAPSLLQHYGLPTEVIDVSAALNVAAFFAVFGARTGHARILVLDTAKVVLAASLLDMAGIAFAARPRSQQGFGMFSRTFANLRSEGFLQAVGAVDYEFPVTGQDSQWLQMSQELLLDVHDPTRAMLVHLLDCMVKNSGPFSYGAARWLAERVPSSPYTVSGWEQPAGDVTELKLTARPGRPAPFDQLLDQQLNIVRWT